MSLFSVALKRAVRKGQVVAKCFHCNFTLHPLVYKEKVPCAVCGMPFNPIYLAPEHVVSS